METTYRLQLEEELKSKLKKVLYGLYFPDHSISFISENKEEVIGWQEKQINRIAAGQEYESPKLVEITFSSDKTADELLEDAWRKYYSKAGWAGRLIPDAVRHPMYWAFLEGKPYTDFPTAEEWYKLHPPPPLPEPKDEEQEDSDHAWYFGDELF